MLNGVQQKTHQLKNSPGPSENIPGIPIKTMILSVFFPFRDHCLAQDFQLTQPGGFRCLYSRLTSREYDSVMCHKPFTGSMGLYIYLHSQRKNSRLIFCWTSNFTNHPLTKHLQETHSLSTLSDVPHGPSFTMKMSWKRRRRMNWKRLHVWFSSTSLAASRSRKPQATCDLVESTLSVNGKQIYTLELPPTQ